METSQALRRDPQGAQQANGYQSGFSFLALRAAFETQTAEHSNSKRRFAEYINGRDIVPGAAYAAPASSYWRCSIYAAIYGKVHDVHALDLLLPEAGAICVLDRG
jgi:hypothetical protein